MSAALEFHLLLETAAERRQHQRLDPAVGSACGGGHLVGQLIGPGGQFGVGHHLGDQPPLRRLLRRQGPVGQHQLLGLGDADQPRQEVGGAAVGAQPDLGVGHRERRRLGGEDEVAGDRDGEARAGGGAVDRGDHHRVHACERRDRTVQVVGDALDVLPAVRRRRERLEIASCAEESARAGEYHDLRRVGVTALRGIGQLASHRVVHAVCGIGPVQRDPRDRAGLLERDGLVFGHTWTLSPAAFSAVHPGMAR